MSEFTKEEFFQKWQELYQVPADEDDWEWFLSLPESDQDAFMGFNASIHVKAAHFIMLAVLVVMALLYIFTHP